MKLLLRLVRFGALAFGLLVLLLVGAWLLRKPLFGDLAKNALVEQLAEALGGTYEVEEIGGTWVTDVEVTGLRTTTPSPDGSVTHLSFERLHVEFDLLALVFGDEPLAAIDKVTLDGGRVDVDLRRGVPEDDEPSTPIFDVLPEDLPRLDVGAEVHLALPDGRIDLTGLGIRSDDGRTVRLGAERVEVPARFGDGGRLEGRVTWTPRLRLSWRSETPLSGVVLAKAFYERGPRVEAHLEVAAGTLQAIYADGGVSAEAEALTWQDLPAWMDALLGEDVSLPGRGGFGFRAQAASLEPLEAAVSFRGEGWQWGGRRVDRVEVVATHDPAATRIASLVVRSDAGSVDASDIRLEPARPYLVGRIGSLDVDVPDVGAWVADLEQPLAVRMQARTDDAEVLEIGALAVRSGESRLAASGSVTLPAEPDRWRETGLDLTLTAQLVDADLADVRIEGRVDVHGRAEGTLARPSGRATVSGRDLRVDGRSVSRLEAVAELTWPRLALTTLRVEAAPGRVGGTARLALEPFAVERARLDLDVPDIAGFLALLPGEMPQIAGSVDGEIDGSYRAGEATGKARVRVADLVVEGTRIGDAEVDVEADGTLLRATRIVADTPWGRAALAATVDLERSTARIAGLDGTAEGHDVKAEKAFDVSWGGEAVALSDFDLTTHGGRVAGSVRIGDGILGDVTLTNVDLASLPLEAEIGGRISGRVRVTDADLAVTLQSEDLAYAGRRGRFAIDLQQQDGPLELRTLSIDAGEALSLEGQGTLPYRYVDGELVPVEGVASDLQLRGSVARFDEITDLRLSDVGFTVEGRGETLTAHVQIGGFVLEGREPLRGTAAVEVEIGPEAVAATFQVSPRGSTTIEGTLRGERGLAWTRPEDWSGFLTRIEELPVRGDVTARVPDLGPWRTLLPDLIELAGRLEAEFHVEGPLRDPHVRGTAVLEGVEGSVDEGLPGLHGTNLRVEAEGRTVRVAGLRGRVGNAPFEVTGQVVFDDRLSQLVEGASVDARARVTVPNLDMLRDIVPALRFLEGRGAVDLRLTGRLLDPDLEGTLALDALQGKLAAGMPPITDGVARLAISGRTVTVRQFKGELAYAPFSLTGTVAMPREQPIDVDLHLEGTNIMIVRDRDLRVRADARLDVKGPLDALVTTGRLDVTNVLYTETMNLFGGGGGPSADDRIQLFSLREGPFATMRFDVDLRASDTIRIRNNVIRGSFSASLHLGGTGEVPEPTGRIWFRETLVKLPYSSLEVDQGELRFPQENPFEPRLQATAHTRMKGYDLTVQLSGTLPDVEIQVSSVPALSQEDALLLLTTGATRAQLQEEGIERAALTRVGSFFGKRLLSKASGPSDPDERSFFDRFTFEMGRDVSRSGQDTVEAEFEITERWYLRAERDRYDDLNAGIVWRLRFR